MRSLRSTLTHCCMFSLKQLTHTRSDGSDGSRLTQTTPRPETSPASDIKHNQHPPTREYQVGPRRLDKFRQDNFMEGGRTARWMVGLCNDEVNAGVCTVEAKAWHATAKATQECAMSKPKHGRHGQAALPHAHVRAVSADREHTGLAVVSGHAVLEPLPTAQAARRVVVRAPQPAVVVVRATPRVLPPENVQRRWHARIAMYG